MVGKRIRGAAEGRKAQTPVSYPHDIPGEGLTLGSSHRNGGGEGSQAVCHLEVTSHEGPLIWLKVEQIEDGLAHGA